MNIRGGGGVEDWGNGGEICEEEEEKFRENGVWLRMWICSSSSKKRKRGREDVWRTWRTGWWRRRRKKKKREKKIFPLLNDFCAVFMESTNFAIFLIKSHRKSNQNIARPTRGFLVRKKVTLLNCDTSKCNDIINESDLMFNSVFTSQNYIHARFLFSVTSIHRGFTMCYLSYYGILKCGTSQSVYCFSYESALHVSVQSVLST